MKFRRTLSGLLLGLGSAITFIGLLALILPTIANDQMRLVLASFDLPTANLLVALINGGMSFALKNAWQVALGGSVLAALGAVLFCALTPAVKRGPSVSASEFSKAVSEQAPVIPSAPARINPYASFAPWERYAPPKQALPSTAASFPMSSPELSPPERPFTAQTVSSPRRRSDLPYRRPKTPDTAQPTKSEATIEPSPTPTHEEMETVHMTFGRSMSYSMPPVSTPVEKKEPSETTYTPNEEPEMLSPRIRSTMGKRHSHS